MHRVICKNMKRKCSSLVTHLPSAVLNIINHFLDVLSSVSLRRSSSGFKSLIPKWTFDQIQRRIETTEWIHGPVLGWRPREITTGIKDKIILKNCAIWAYCDFFRYEHACFVLYVDHVECYRLSNDDFTKMYPYTIRLRETAHVGSFDLTLPSIGQNDARMIYFEMIHEPLVDMLKKIV
jgi:hypothetical protein